MGNAVRFGFTHNKKQTVISIALERTTGETKITMIYQTTNKLVSLHYWKMFLRRQFSSFYLDLYL